MTLYDKVLEACKMATSARSDDAAVEMLSEEIRTRTGWPKVQWTLHRQADGVAHIAATLEGKELMFGIAVVKTAPGHRKVIFAEVSCDIDFTSEESLAEFYKQAENALEELVKKHIRSI